MLVLFVCFVRFVCSKDSNLLLPWLLVVLCVAMTNYAALCAMTSHASLCRHVDLQII